MAHGPPLIPAGRGVTLPIVTWGATVTSRRQPSPTEVLVSTVRAKADAAIVPRRLAADGLAACRAARGDRFVLRDGLLAVVVSNLDPQNHMAIALCNLRRMETVERWNQCEQVTPAVGRLREALDDECLAVAEALGLRIRTFLDHFPSTFRWVR